MIVLPARTSPPDEPFEARHHPRAADGPGGYRVYRSCLRWEFGFTCPYCLLHEADFAWSGAEGLGVFWIEHYHSISETADLSNDYKNCIYSCRFCNRARSALPVLDDLGRRLLNPRVDTWSDHFVRSKDHLQPRAGDTDAEYTCDAYDANDERKVFLRATRRDILEESLDLLEEGQEVIESLLREEDVDLLLAAAELRRYVHLARFIVERFAAVPADAEVPCRCGQESPTLPPGLRKQCHEVTTLGSGT